VELPGEGGLIGVSAVLRHGGDRFPTLAEPIAGALDSGPRQILSGRKSEKRADALIEPKNRQTGARGEVGNAQGTIEVGVEISQRFGKRPDVRQRLGRRS
jgi:hypothetical protein